MNAAQRQNVASDITFDSQVKTVVVFSTPSLPQFVLKRMIHVDNNDTVTNNIEHTIDKTV